MRSFVIVAVGGAVGTLARHGVGETITSYDPFPYATFVVNLSGSFLLGLLATLLVLRGADSGARRDARLLLGTGLLGGYTTYSALAVETEQLLRFGEVQVAVVYALGTAVLGLVAALAGIATARAVSP